MNATDVGWILVGVVVVGMIADFIRLAIVRSKNVRHD